MPQPVHLGWVKFGARNGCPCGPGEKAITYVKFQNGNYPYFRVDGKQSYLSMNQTGDLWHVEDIPAAVWNPRGNYPRFRGLQEFDRRTGISTGGRINVYAPEAGAPEFPKEFDSETLVRYAYDVAAFTGFTDVRRGSLIQTNAYTPGALREDLGVIISSPEASLALVPSGQSAYAGMREANPRGLFETGWLDAAKESWVRLFHRNWPWSGVDWIDLGLCDGAVKLHRRQAFNWSSLHWDMSVESVLSWTQYMSMQRVQAPLMGYISTQESWRALLNGDEAATKPWVVGPKLYWYVDRGPFQITSTWITDADADSTDAVFSRRVKVTPNDPPPEGVRAVPWGQYGTASDAIAC